MGYHIILQKNTTEIEHFYVEQFNEIANYNITETSIIYESEEKWKPEIVGASNKYKNFSTPRFRASYKAEQIFKNKANKLGYIIETLNQDKESYQFYNNAIKNCEEYKYVKRGDFLIRNLLNLEIEVKCKTVYYKKDDKVGAHFYLEKEHIERHNNMFAFTQTPIVFAIYQRDDKDESIVKEKKLFMISLKEVNEIIKKYDLKPIKRDYGDTYKISINACKKDFKLLEEYKLKL